MNIHKIKKIFILEEGFGKGATDIQQGDNKPFQENNKKYENNSNWSLKDDARRKRKERQGDNRIKDIEKRKKEKAKAKETGETIDPRNYLNGVFKLTLKETFLNHLIKYIDEGQWDDLNECLSLMEEYPKLESYVIQKSQGALPPNGFSIFACRQHFNEQIGETVHRSGDSPHMWTLTAEAAINTTTIEEAVVLEARITADKALLYIPAFNKDMEELIFSGKIEEPQKNVLRIAKKEQKLIVPNSINEGVVIGYKGI